MLLGRAAPVVNARLPLTEAMWSQRTVAEAEDRHRQHRHRIVCTPHAGGSGAKRSGHPHFELCTLIQRRCCLRRSETSAAVRGDITFARGIRQASALTTGAAGQVTLTYLKRDERVRHVFCELSLRF